MRRRVLASIGKPLPYLRKMAYLESNGNQYIDTGVYGDERTEISAVVMVIRFSANIANQCAGCIGGENGFGFQFAKPNNTGAFSRIDGATVGGFPFCEINVWAEASMDRRGVIQEGVLHAFSTSVSSFVTPSTMLAFRAANSQNYGAMRISHLNISKDGVLERAYIPVIDLYGRPAMFDEVSGQLFYNQGTGEFSYGEITANTNGGGYKCVNLSRSRFSRRSRSWRISRPRHFRRWEVAA